MLIRYPPALSRYRIFPPPFKPMSVFLHRLRALTPPGQLCSSFEDFFQLTVAALDAQQQAIARLERAAAEAATKRELQAAQERLHGELQRVGQVLRGVEAEQVVVIDGQDVPVSDLVQSHHRRVGTPRLRTAPSPRLTQMSAAASQGDPRDGRRCANARAGVRGAVQAAGRRRACRRRPAAGASERRRRSVPHVARMPTRPQLRDETASAELAARCVPRSRARRRGVGRVR